MASTRRVIFSLENLSLAEIAEHHEDIEFALRTTFSASQPLTQSRFASDTTADIQSRLNECLQENETGTILQLLASLEASLRIDYLQRCYKKKKDRLSREFRSMYRQKGVRVSLEEEILDLWKVNSSVPPQIISDLRSAFRYRHWLAHGRYWSPRLGGRFDYFAIYTLAQQVYDSFPLEGPV